MLCLKYINYNKIIVVDSRPADLDSDSPTEGNNFQISESVFVNKQRSPASFFHQMQYFIQIYLLVRAETHVRFKHIELEHRPTVSLLPTIAKTMQDVMIENQDIANNHDNIKNWIF